MKPQIAKGTFDLLPKDPAPDGQWRSSHLWLYLQEVIHSIAKAYGCKFIQTPIFEKTDLFVRSVGETSDIVTKEMYTFEDKGGRSLTLRPEGTAAIIRAFIEKSLDQQGSRQKFYYIGPMFRYERPQLGRYRQHHQFGVEAIGNPQPEQDVEMIDLLYSLYQRLGLKNLSVQINSVGNEATRNRYKEALKEYLAPQKDKLSATSQVRFEKNVLRILDSKDSQDLQLIESAPSIVDFLQGEPKEHFEKVLELMEMLSIPYQINPRLVRGLDYYTSTVFEITANELGAQNAIGAGGRYDGLIQKLGGKPLPAVGFAVGLERVIQTMIGQNISLPLPPHPDLMIIPLGLEAKKYAYKLVHTLRSQGICADGIWKETKIAKALEYASLQKATYALVLGEEELQKKNGKLKELATRKESELSFDQIVTFILGNQKKLD